MNRYPTIGLRNVLRLWLGAILFLAAPQLILAAPPAHLATVSATKSRTSLSTFQLQMAIGTVRSTDKISLKVGNLSFSLPGSALKRDKKTKLLKFTAKKQALGISSALLDTKNKIFKFSLRGAPLIDQNFPLRVEVAIGKKRLCTIMGGGGIKKGAVRLVDLGKCPKPNEGLSANIGVIQLGSETEGIFSLRATERLAQPTLFSADASGKALRKLCDLRDSGSPTQGDLLAGDGLYSCKLPLRPNSLGKSFYVAKAKRRGSITFPGISIPVIGSVTAQDVKGAYEAQNIGLEILKSFSSQPSPEESSNLELLQQLLSLPGVAGAGFSPNGIDLILQMTSGIDVILILNTRVLAPTGQELRRALSSKLEERSYSPNSVSKRAMSSSSSAALKIFLYDPGYFPNLENETIKSLAAAADPGELSFTLIEDEQSEDVSSFNSMPGHDLIVLTTHGSIDKNGRVGFVMPLNDEKKLYQEYLPLLQSGKLVLSALGNIGPGYDNNKSLLVMPSYFSDVPGSFAGATVFGSSCYSAANGTMATAFLAKGAAGYIGFDEVVRSNFAEDKVVEFLCSTLVDRKTIGEAYDGLAPKTDSVGVKLEGTWHPPATVRFSGNPSDYVGGEISFKNLYVDTIPNRTLLFFGESADAALEIGGSRQPPCFKYRLRNNNPEMVSVSRKLSTGEFTPIGDEVFSENKLKFTAKDTKGLPDLSFFIVNDKDDSVVGKGLPEVEVLCAKPAPGSLVANSPTVNIGQEAIIQNSSISGPGCDLYLLFAVDRLDATGKPSGDSNNCGKPLNPEVTLEVRNDTPVNVIPFSALPIRLSTSAGNCPNTSKLVLYYDPVVRSSLSQFAASGRTFNPEVRNVEITLNKNPALQTGNLETRFMQFTRTALGVTYDYYYIVTLPFITPPTPGQTGRYCVQIDTKGVPGPDGQEGLFPFPSTTEYFVVSEDPCLSLAEFPGFDRPTAEECGDWLEGMLGLSDFGVPPNFGVEASWKINIARGQPCNPATSICSLQQAIDHFAPLRQWTFKARRLTGNQSNCAQ